jgi:hypothetical protein
LEFLNVVDACETLWIAGVESHFTDVVVDFWFDAVDKIDE